MRKKKGFSCRINPDILDKFRAKVIEDGVTQSEMIEVLIQSYLDDEIMLVRKIEVNSK